MNSTTEGWYVDPSTGSNLRLWSGTAWTDEVAPLPGDPAGAQPNKIFGDASNETGAEWQEAPGLERELEATRLSRRSLRAKRGEESAPDDAPKHLPSKLQPPVAPMPSAPVPVSVAEWESGSRFKPRPETITPAPASHLIETIVSASDVVEQEHSVQPDQLNAPSSPPSRIRWWAVAVILAAIAGVGVLVNTPG